jgi:hypothetical protein
MTNFDKKLEAIPPHTAVSKFTLHAILPKGTSLIIQLASSVNNG